MEKGYVILKNVSSPDDVSYGHSCFVEQNKVNYDKMKHHLGWENPGDLLIFNSSLLHSGNFPIKVDNRRLIQIFDTTPFVCRMSSKAFSRMSDETF